MKAFTVYLSTSGEILRTGICMDDAFELQPQTGESIIEGTFDWRTQIIANGAAVAKP